jgi:hypothetical protein
MVFHDPLLQGLPLRAASLHTMKCGSFQEVAACEGVVGEGNKMIVHDISLLDVEKDRFMLFSFPRHACFMTRFFKVCPSGPLRCKP